MIIIWRSVDQKGSKGIEYRRQLPIGKDDFAKIRKSNSYYVDKSLLIRDFINMNDEVALIARPRRFGKTLSAT